MYPNAHAGVRGLREEGRQRQITCPAYAPAHQQFHSKDQSLHVLGYDVLVVHPARQVRVLANECKFNKEAKSDRMPAAPNNAAPHPQVDAHGPSRILRHG